MALEPERYKGTDGRFYKRPKFFGFEPDRYRRPNLNLQDTPQAARSLLGTPVYSDMTLIAPDLTFELPILSIQEVIFSVSQNKRIIKHTVPGRDGTVKDYIGLGDFIINVDGALVSGYTDNAPYKTTTANLSTRVGATDLLEYLNYNDRLQIRSKFLNALGITQVVVDHFKITEKRATRNVIPFRIQFSSDGPDELVVTVVDTPT